MYAQFIYLMDNGMMGSRPGATRALWIKGCTSYLWGALWPNLHNFPVKSAVFYHYLEIYGVPVHPVHPPYGAPVLQSVVEERNGSRLHARNRVFKEDLPKEAMLFALCLLAISESRKEPYTEW